MLLIGALWLTGLVTWMAWSLKRQLADIRTFAELKAKPVTAAQPGAEEITALQSRLTAYAEAVKAGTKAELKLSAADLNALIATVEKLKGLKEVLKVAAITDVLNFEVSVAMNGVPFMSQRYFLNGIATATIEKQSEKGAMLNTKSIEVHNPTAERKVSEGFLKTYREHNPLDSLVLDEVRNDKSNRLVEILKATTALRLAEGMLVLDYAPAAPAPAPGPATPAPAAPR